ncbi:MAG: hypothetical protein MUD08_12950 [Cytophagales bacterium]|jgi:hypothetical protein|nr:hypothetical protein [Cytophagales bacterium]
MKQIDKFLSNPTRILIVGGLFSLFAPVFFTLPAWCEWLVFTQTGQIGDTIGGIVGPILNFTGLLLVYISIQKQIEANTLQKEALQASEQAAKEAITLQREAQQASEIIAKEERELRTFLVIFEQMKSTLDSITSQSLDDLFQDELNIDNWVLLDEFMKNSKVNRLSLGLELAVRLTREARIKRFHSTADFVRPVLLSYFNTHIATLYISIYKRDFVKFIDPRNDPSYYDGDKVNTNNRSNLIYTGIVRKKILVRLREIETFVEDFNNQNMGYSSSEREILDEERDKIRDFENRENIGDLKLVYDFLQDFHQRRNNPTG